MTWQHPRKKATFQLLEETKTTIDWASFNLIFKQLIAALSGPTRTTSRLRSAVLPAMIGGAYYGVYPYPVGYE
jgi:hypothetical protein